MKNGESLNSKKKSCKVDILDFTTLQNGFAQNIMSFLQYKSCLKEILQ